MAGVFSTSICYYLWFGTGASKWCSNRCPRHQPRFEGYSASAGGRGAGWPGAGVCELVQPANRIGTGRRRRCRTLITLTGDSGSGRTGSSSWRGWLDMRQRRNRPDGGPAGGPSRRLRRKEASEYEIAQRGHDLLGTMPSQITEGGDGF